jgi:O-antigen/teichoic acid export membrane protein
LTHGDPGTGIRRKVVVGAFALLIRQGFVKAVQVAGGIVLARLLTPADFGVYAIVSFVVAFFTLVGGAGLGAALIQQTGEPTDRVLRVVFTAQTLILLVASAALLLLAPLLADAYRLGEETVWLMRLLVVGLFASGLRTIPELRLERALEFGRLSLADATQAVVFQVVAIMLALNHLGPWSFGIAAVLGTVSGTIVANVLAPWRPGLAWDGALLRNLLRFGLPYQGAGLISFFKEAVNPVFVGVILGAVAVGYVNWATLVIAYPVIFVAVLNRLYFPVFSRLQDRPEALRPFAEAIIRWNVFVAVGVALPYLLMARYWTATIFGEQWLPGVPLLFLCALGIPLGAAASPGLAILNAFGRSGEALFFTSLWMATTWIFTVPAVMILGYVGFGVANALVQLTNPWFFRRVQTAISISIWPSIWIVALASAVAAGAELGLLSVDPRLGEGLGPLVLAAVVVAAYVATWMLASAGKVREDVGAVRSALRR